MIEIKIEDGALIFVMNNATILPSKSVVIEDSDGNLHSVGASNVEVNDNSSLYIDGVLFKISELKCTTLNNIAEQTLLSECIYFKSTVPQVIENVEQYTGLYRAVVKACLNSRPLPLTQPRHNEKLTLFRELAKVATGVKPTMSLLKLERLLEFHGLTIKDLLKEEYR